MEPRILVIGELDSGGWLPSGAIAEGAVNLSGCDAVLVFGRGADEIRRIRRASAKIPVIAVNGDATVEDRLAMFDAGADDCVAAPLDERELKARIAACHRRALRVQMPALSIGGLRIERLEGRLLRDGERVDLSAKEFQLIQFLALRPGQVHSRAEILREVWGYRSGATRTVDMHVASIRRKLEADTRAPKYLLTVRGQGYCVAAPPAAGKEDFTRAVPEAHNLPDAAAFIPDRRFS